MDVPATEMAMKAMWDDAAKTFENICGESLTRGEVKSFDDVQKRIDSSNGVSNGLDAGRDDNWEKAKSAGLKSLKFLKMLVGAASQASSFIPIPSEAATITASALSFVFDIPKIIKGYNEAVKEVFTEISSALSQFQIFESMDGVDPRLIRQIHFVLVSFVKLCAHVVKYRQGRRRDRLLRVLKTIVDEDGDLANEMAVFKAALQRQRDVEGTLTLAAVVETNHDIAILLEQYITFSKIGEETHEVVQETQKGVLALKEEVDRTKTLMQIRDTLGVLPTVRLDGKTTYTCTVIAERCQKPETGGWIWTSEAYIAWTAALLKDKAAHTCLLVTGPPSSGKTSTSALITKRLEERKEEDRVYVAHYFFPASTDKSNDEKNPVPAAIKYMAFQIARVDATVRKALGKACQAGPAAFKRTQSLDSLWSELKIGTVGSGTIYYLIFDGLEYLPDEQVHMLLSFVFGPKLAGESAGRVRILLAGTEDIFSGWASAEVALRIQMQDHNDQDMRLIVEDALARRGILQNPKPNSDQLRARETIIDRLPQKVGGSYFRLQLGLEEVVRLMSTRSAGHDIDALLDQSTSSHEAAIKALERSLTIDEIGEVNELLKWVLFSKNSTSLGRLESAMFLFSGTESFVSLQYIIKTKYLAVLKLEDGFVYGQDGVKDYFIKELEAANSLSHSSGLATISMTITINNVDQELCGHFLWDLAHKAIRDKFKFDFDSNSPSGGLISSSGRGGSIRVDEFDAHRTIVRRTFEFLSKPPVKQTAEIGIYLVSWLPYHLDALRNLEGERKGMLPRDEAMEIGQQLYTLFRDQEVFNRHMESFAQTWWEADEIMSLQEWLKDSAVMRKVDKRWRDEVQQATSPVRGYLREFVNMIVKGFLRERTCTVQTACSWIEEFLLVSWPEQKDEKLNPPTATFPATGPINEDNGASISSVGGPSNDKGSGLLDWYRVSAWCQAFLDLPDSELDSLWYERLAEASMDDSWGGVPRLSVALWKQAIERKDPSWRCYRGLGLAYSLLGQTADAIAQIELALIEAGREGASPAPEAEDLDEMHLQLANLAYKAEKMQSAAEHYKVVCKSKIITRAREGQLGYLKARLEFPDTEGTRQLLRSMLAANSGPTHIADILKIIAVDEVHDTIVTKVLAIANQDPDLLHAFVRAMEAATSMSPGGGVRAPLGRMLPESDERFAEDEIRGVLLYDRGVAAYSYGVCPMYGTNDPVTDALDLWLKSRQQLNGVGGRNAFVAREAATSALARHYFQYFVDNPNLKRLDLLTDIIDGDGYPIQSEPVGFLGALHALRAEADKARELLRPRVKLAMQILSDDLAENDFAGFWILMDTLARYRDFRNAGVALSLAGQPDTVLEAMRFAAGDLDHEVLSTATLNLGLGRDYSTVLNVSWLDPRRERLLGLINKLARETTQAAHTAIPDPAEQTRRIKAAKAHVEAQISAAKAALAELELDKTGAALGDAVELVAVLAFVYNRIRDIKPRTGNLVTCDGPGAPHDNDCSMGGTTRGCTNEANFSRAMYQCIYCADRSFCEECLALLRQADEGVMTMVCSRTHQWLRFPPQGGSTYVGVRAEKARMPLGERNWKGDPQIIEIVYDADGGEEITVEDWKAGIAREWDISIEAIQRKMSTEGGGGVSKSG